MFWEDEKPKVIISARNTFRYYPKAQKLAVCLPDYQDRKTGETKIGKTTVVDLDALKRAPQALDGLIQILRDLKARPEE